MFRNNDQNELEIFLAFASLASTIGAYGLYRFLRKKPTHSQDQKPEVPAAVAEEKAPRVYEPNAPMALDIRVPAALLDDAATAIADEKNPVAIESKVVEPIQASQSVSSISIFNNKDTKSSTPTFEAYQKHTPSSLLNAIRCPISLEIIQDPVMTRDGHTYDKKSIQEWFESGHDTSPLTNLPLNDMTLLPNHAMKRLIEEILSLSPEPKKTREEIETEQKQIAHLLQPLEIYVHATGLQALLKKHQGVAKPVLLKLRTELYILNRCEAIDMQDKLDFIRGYITKSKPNKNTGDYLDALRQVEKNIKDYYEPMIKKALFRK